MLHFFKNLVVLKFFAVWKSNEIRYALYIFFVVPATCLVVSTEACKNLILDTDSGMGRQEAFHYEDLEDVAIIMNRLFSVDMNSNIVSNIYVREMTG